MVAVDAAGSPRRISGAALAGGPLLAIAAGRRPSDPPRVTGAAPGGFSGAFAALRAAPALVAAPPDALATQLEALPARWGIPSFFSGAPFGPPYELENRAAEWLLSSETGQSFFPTDRQARMALRTHPRGPSLETGPQFLAALYDAAPTPRSLGVGVDVIR